MSEETTETTTEAPVTPAPATVETPQSFIDDAGNFTEGWETAYLTEDQRANTRVVNGRVTGIGNMLDIIANGDKMIGSDNILKPSESSGEEEWNEYHKAGGWTGEVIPMAAPEGLPDGLWNEDRGTAFSTLFNDLKLSPAQQAGIKEAYNADLMQQVTDHGNNTENAAAELNAGLVSDWGNAFEQKKHLGNAAIEKGIDSPEHKERLLAKFANDPDFIRFAANIGGKFSESGSMPNVDVSNTPADTMAQINKIHTSDAFLKPMHPENKSTMATLTRLYEENART